MTFPFRLGATSYITPGDLVENARMLARDLEAVRAAPQQDGADVCPVSHMQLVLFHTSGGPSNLPDAATVAALRAIADTSGLGYTVHLIRDLCVDDLRAQEEARRYAQDVMARTLPLAPAAYVVHLAGATLRAANYAHRDAWTRSMVGELARVGAGSDATCRLAVENLEGYPPDLVADAACQSGAGRCVDVGHLWLDGHDPIPYLDAAQRLRVVHLHGVGDDPARGRVVDHLALDRTSLPQLDAVCDWLHATRFSGVVTLEVFGADDFRRSVAAFGQAWRRACGRAAD